MRNIPQCRYCDRPAKLKFHKGIFKGYHKNCEAHLFHHRRPGSEHPNASKGGRRYNEQGYVQVLRPNRADAKGPGSQYILEHRLVIEQHLGRTLEAHEVVHHANGVRDDNRIDNLVLIDTRHEDHESRTLIKALQQHIRNLECEIDGLRK